MTSAKTKLFSATGLVALLIATGVVAATTPSAADWEQPFVVHASIGEPITGRNIAVTVHAATVTDRVFDDRWSSTPGSTWVVVDASAAVVHTETAATIRHAVLVVGDHSYAASMRPSAFMLNSVALSIDVPTRGLLAFELPADALSAKGAERARLELAMNADPRLDSMIVATIDLTTVPALAEVELSDAVWGER